MNLRVLQCLSNESQFNIDGIKVLDSHRSVLQLWATFLFEHIDVVDDGKVSFYSNRHVNVRII